MKKLTPLICIAALGLSACGSDPEAQQGIAKAKAIAKTIMTRGTGTSEPAPTPEEALIATLQASSVPVAAIAIEAQAVALPFVETARNGRVRTWTNGAKQTISTNGGLIVATRGYGDDLMASDSPEIISLIANKRNGSENREMYFNDGSDTNIRFVVPCSITRGGTENIQTLSGLVSTTKMVESCATGAFEVQNTYWVNGGGTTLQSRQWLSSGIGYVVFSQVRG